MAQTAEPHPRKPLRLWPGVVAVALLWLVRFGVKIVVPGFKGFKYSMMGGLLSVLVIVVWWLFLSRARWSERLGAIALMIVSLVAAWRFKHESMGPLWLVGYAVPVLMLAFVAWAVASRRLRDGPRRAAMVATILLACGVWTLVRTDGIDGDHDANFGWRWQESPEERLIAHAADELIASTPTPAATAWRPDPVWPGFRGPERDGIVRGVRIETDWSRSPPVELWRRPIGPGWSSFAVGGGLLYTQEQRGDDEVVSSYSLTTASRCGRTATGPGSSSRMPAPVRAGRRP